MLNFSKFAPFANRVLIKRVEPLAKSKGGIILSNKEELNYGTVMMAGPGITLNNGVLRENAVKVGQTVLLPGYSGAKVTLADKQEYFVFRDDDIIGVLEDPVQ